MSSPKTITVDLAQLGISKDKECSPQLVRKRPNKRFTEESGSYVDSYYDSDAPSYIDRDLISDKIFDPIRFQYIPKERCPTDQVILVWVAGVVAACYGWRLMNILG